MSEQSESSDLITSIKNQLVEIDALPTSAHAPELEGVHRKLEAALSTIDGL